ncbi:sodium- and chloride-dependent GABA transporter 2-like [Vanacampus margaritifer]
MESIQSNTWNDRTKAEAAPKGQPREQWSRKMEFILATAGNLIGLGNIWRFPYRCYKNGGGVFLVPYMLFFCTCGIPLFFLETSLGQYTRQGGMICWRKVCPLFEEFGGDCIYLCLLNGLTSFVAGFAIFSVLGFMAKEQGVDISMVAESGPGLAFIAYPSAVALMPLPQLWAICFFAMIIFIGLDSEFVNIEALVTNTADAFPSVFGNKCRRKLLLLAVCVASFFAGLVMVTEGGLYVFQLFDHYACSGMTLLFFAILESICIGWFYGADRLYDNIKDMIGYRPWPFMKYCWQYLTPAICTKKTQLQYWLLAILQ